MHRLASLPTRELPGGLRVAEARTVRARLLGLAFAPPPPSGLALHLPRTRSVHTLGMRYALDLVWLDRRGAVVRLDEGVAPGRLRACRRARSVLEARAGEGAAYVRAASAPVPPADCSA